MFFYDFLIVFFQHLIHKIKIFSSYISTSRNHPIDFFTAFSEFGHFHSKIFSFHETSIIPVPLQPVAG